MEITIKIYDCKKYSTNLLIYVFTGEDVNSENLPLLSRAKKEKTSAKKQLKELQFCK